MKRLIALVLMLALTLSLGCVAFAESWACPDCGTMNNDKFCGNCGRDRDKPLGAQRDSIIDFSRSADWFCLNCGSKINTTFCTHCGEKRSEGLVGSIVTFGAYEQDNDLSNGPEPIEWLVLAEENGQLLVISRYGLDEQPYHTEYVGITWETCTLRTWLNGEFLNAAFNAEEQAMIPTVKVTADKNPEYGTITGKDTQDKVFLLSIKEANRYTGGDEARKCVPTAYAKANGAYTNDSYTVGGAATCWWWLRSPGNLSNYAAYVSGDGSVYDYGRLVFYSDCCVRPALWISY